MAILSKEQKMNKWYVKWGIDATEAIILKFGYDPADAEAQAAADNFIANRLLQQAKDKRISRVMELIDRLKDKTIEYIEQNPTATKVEILTFMRNIIQSGGIN